MMHFDLQRQSERNKKERKHENHPVGKAGPTASDPGDGSPHL